MPTKTFDRAAFVKSLLLLRVSRYAFVGPTRVGGIQTRSTLPPPVTVTNHGSERASSFVLPSLYTQHDIYGILIVLVDRC